MTVITPDSQAPPRSAEPATHIPVSGLVDLGDGHGFVRTSGYRAGPSDVYVSAGQIRQY